MSAMGLALAIGFLSFCSGDEFALPEVHVSASSHYDLGFQLGRHFQNMIKAELTTNNNLQTVLLPFYASANGKQVVEAFRAANEKAFPLYFDELRGMAAGSNASFEQILLMNLQQELSYFTPPSNQSFFWEQCSDSLLLTQSEALIGHNEDSGGIDRNHTYIVHAHIESSSSTPTAPDFHAYVYAGQLPSSAFGWNDAGVIFTLNALGPSKSEVPVPTVGGLGRNFISRALLAVTDATPESCMDLICQRGQSVGHSYNFMLFNRKNKDNFSDRTTFPRILNVETASGGRCSALELTRSGGGGSGGGGERNGSYFHTNTYTHFPGIAQASRNDSLRRLKRAAALPAPSNAQDIRSLLGDGHDVDYPIYMHSTGGEQGAFTLHTALFDGAAQSCSVYQGNPARDPVTELYQFSLF